MTEIIRQKLSDSKAARWTVLGVVAITMFCGYYITDVMAPLMDMLQAELKWNGSEYGLFTSSYVWFNVFLVMLIFSGIILDKLGVRRTGIISCLLMIVGCFLKYYAVANPQLFTGSILGIKSQVVIASIGFAIFGTGVETAGITVTKVIARWFKGHEMALAMGLQVAVARIGTGVALGTAIPLSKALNSLSAPILLGLAFLCVGLVSYLVFCVMDKKLDKSLADSTEEPEEPFKVRDILDIIKIKGFWLIALLCVLFYSAIFPFVKFATSIITNKYGVDAEFAGSIVLILSISTMLLTPFFGGLYDNKGKGATIMIIGAVLLIITHTLFAMPINYWWFSIILMSLLGIAFSLVPSAMWPSVPKIIPENKLGTAYGLIFWVQNIGLGGVPLLIGWVLEKYCKVGEKVAENGNSVPIYDYTIPLVIFACFGVLALFVAFALKAEDKKKGYGLELPNIKK